jgi:hypothetical protein
MLGSGVKAKKSQTFGPVLFLSQGWIFTLEQGQCFLYG